MDDLIKKLDAATKAMWMERPTDVERMVGRNFDTGKEFSVWVYTWGDLGNLGDLLYEYYQIGLSGSGDLVTVRTLASRQCVRYASALKNTAHLNDCVAILDEAAEAFKGVGDFEDLARLSRHLQRYVMHLSFWVDMELPWPEVSELVDQRWHQDR